MKIWRQTMQNLFVLISQVLFAFPKSNVCLRLTAMVQVSYTNFSICLTGIYARMSLYLKEMGNMGKDKNQNLNKLICDAIVHFSTITPDRFKNWEVHSMYFCFHSHSFFADNFFKVICNKHICFVAYLKTGKSQKLLFFWTSACNHNDVFMIWNNLEL